MFFNKFPISLIFVIFFNREECAKIQIN